MAGKIVIIFDFDRTLIEDDSDRWVFTRMDLTQLFRDLRPTLPWNSLMDRLLEEMHVLGKSIDDIADCLRGMPLHPSVVSVIKQAHALGCDLKVASDSNQFYIRTILEHYGIYSCFSEIITNPAVVDKGRLRIFPYHGSAAPHGCDLCPSNLCKGRVIEQIQVSLSESESKRLIYVGDGGNDFCPTLKLAAGDFVLPRKDFPLLSRISKNSNLVKAKVCEWNSSEDLAKILGKLIECMSNEDKISSSTTQL
ncbi:thiamine phosphate phosphatase-like protein [Salvia splendens]|uniref:thiamine phosphate phosphatase-like protein n=1 Tax=Salvia splendens TaxID=180675 RepID=UPI001C26A503|nr:thiamine phosphate phosphatase-like protein [Salvia splendens]